MRERPILFSGPMVRAILDGSKTQTRRVVKPQPPEGHSLAGFCMASTHKADEGKAVWGAGDTLALMQDPHRVRCPYGQPGDRLWVRETWGVLFNDEVADVENEPTWYRATDDKPGQVVPARWRPSIHMPRARSRITLEINGVRVERLQSISVADIKAEGVTVPVCAETGNVLIDISTKDGPAAFLTREQYADCDAVLRAHWAALWCSVNGRASWDANPWVWVVEFKRGAE